jgi:hypothetical protein
LVNAIKVLSKRNPTGKQKYNLSRILGIYIIIFSLFFFGKSDGYKLNKFIAGIKGNHSFEKFKYLSMIPKAASVSATANLVPHLSHSKYIYDWRPEASLPETEYYVIDLEFTGYLNNQAKKQIPEFLKQAQLKFKQVFVNSQKTFFIFFNPYADIKKIGDYRGNLGLKF